MKPERIQIFPDSGDNSPSRESIPTSEHEGSVNVYVSCAFTFAPSSHPLYLSISSELIN